MGTITTIAVGTLIGTVAADVYQKTLAPAVNDLLKNIFGDNKQEETKKTEEKK